MGFIVRIGTKLACRTQSTIPSPGVVLSMSKLAILQPEGDKSGTRDGSESHARPLTELSGRHKNGCIRLACWARGLGLGWHAKPPDEGLIRTN